MKEQLERNEVINWLENKYKTTCIHYFPPMMEVSALSSLSPVMLVENTDCGQSLVVTTQNHGDMCQGLARLWRNPFRLHVLQSSDMENCLYFNRRCTQALFRDALAQHGAEQ